MPRNRLLSPEHSGPEQLSLNRSIAERWEYAEVLSKGYVAVPKLFLEVYARLKPHPLTTGEAMFVLQLMSFKWTRKAPYPSYKRLAELMNVTDKMVRRYAQSLETKSYLSRKLRKNNTNLFDLTGLFDALLAVAKNENVIKLPAGKFGNIEAWTGGGKL